TPTGATLALEVAADPVSRTRGLGGRDGLAAGTVMALAFPQPVTVAIWMKDMRFDLDVVWVRGDRVVDLYEEMPAPEPGTPDNELPVYVGQAPADVVLELAGGTARALRLTVVSTRAVDRSASVEARKRRGSWRTSLVEAAKERS